MRRRCATVFMGKRLVHPQVPIVDVPCLSRVPGQLINNDRIGPIEIQRGVVTLQAMSVLEHRGEEVRPAED